MIVPDSLYLQSSLLVNSKNNWLVLNNLKLLFISKNIYNDFSERDQDLLLKFDFFGLLNLDLTTIEVDNLHSLVIQRFNDFQIFVRLLGEIEKFYKFNSFDNFDILIFNYRIFKFFSTSNLSEFQGKDLAFKSILDWYLANIKSPSNFSDLFYNFYTTAIYYKDFSSLVRDLERIIDLYSQLILKKEKVEKLYEITLFYRAYIKLPKEVFSYTDDISVAGFLFSPSEQDIENQLNSITTELNDIQYIQDQLSVTNTFVIENSEVNHFLKVISSIYPSVAESIYNLNQIIKGSEPNFTEKIEIIFNGKFVEINTHYLINSEVFDLIVDEVITLSEEQNPIEIQDLLGYLTDFITELRLKNLDDDNVGELLATTEIIFKGIIQCYQNNNVNLFKRHKDYNLLEFIDLFSEAFPYIYKSFSGDLTSLEFSNGFNISKISENIKSYLNLQIKFLRELKSNETKLKTLNARVQFFKNIISKRYEVFKYTNDHAKYIEELYELARDLNIIDHAISIDVLINNLGNLKKELDLIANATINRFNDLLGNSENKKEEIEKFQILISILNKIGLNVEINGYSKQIHIEIQEEALKDYLRGYNNTEVIDSEYAIENLTAFGIYTL